MCAVDVTLNVKNEADALAAALSKGDPEASLHLARLIEADTNGVFQPFAQALAARLRDHLHPALIMSFFAFSERVYNT